MMLRLPFCFLLLAALLLTPQLGPVAFHGAAFAQTATTAAQEETDAVQSLERRAESLINAFEAAGDDDARLAVLRGDADAMVAEARDLLATVDERLNTSRDALMALGDPPADGTEDAAVSRQREELSSQVQSLQARSVALNTTINTAVEVRTEIANLRRDAFARRVMDRTNVNSALFSEGLESYRVRLIETGLLIKNWFVLNVRNEAFAFLGAIAFGFAAAFL
ncbi:MAG: hypothetical protein AAFY73_11705, partial [Pseudomonadota bacterium]